MTLPTELLALVVVLVVGAFIAQPFLAERRSEGGFGGRRAASVLRQRAGLLAERNRIYSALRDLDFDYKTNKVADEDYTAQRYQLVAAGVDILQQLDGLPALDETPGADPLETAIALLRSGDAAATALSGLAADDAAGFCPACGQPVLAGDRFCGSCGGRL
jgi:hypothetical protein